MGETILLILVCLVVAVGGAWDSTRCRHGLGQQHKRRRTDA